MKLSEAKLNKAHCLLDQEKAKSQQKILALEEEVKYLKNRLEIQKTIEDKLKEQVENVLFFMTFLTLRLSFF